MQWNDRTETGIVWAEGWRTLVRVAGFLGWMAILFPAGLTAAGGDRSVKKPQGPIALQFSTEGSIAVGSEVTVTLTVTPLISSESTTVSILLPEKLSLLGGDTSWTGPLEKNQSHVLTIQVRPELAESLEIRAHAVLALVGGSQMSRHAVLMLDLDPDKPKPELRSRPGPGGNSILEIPAQSRPKTK